MSGASPCSEDQVERLADLVAERIVERLRGLSPERELIDAAEVARRFSVSREYVYDHADDLGGIRMGKGPRSRWRFDTLTVKERLTHHAAPVRESSRMKHQAVRRGPKTDLLPVKGGSP